ncbi:MAG TPA: glycosyltransferase family 2 protein [bacterium]
MAAVREPRATLSVCVIAGNEEDRIAGCLASVAWADEIIVVDSVSADRTAEIARASGARVIVREWPGYVAQKNFALEQATGDWVLCLDADERISPRLAEGIRGVLAGDGGAFAAYRMARRTFHLGRWILHGGWYPDRKVRLVRRGRARWGGIDPHDRLEPDGAIGDLAGDIEHYTYRDIADHLRTIDRFTTVAARELHARGRGGALRGMLLHPPAKFLKMYLLKAGFLDGAPGFVIAVLGGYYVFLKYAKLWELRRAAGRREA